MFRGVFGQINKITTTTGKRGEVVRLVMSGPEQLPECRLYLIATDAKNEDVFWVTEVWDSEASQMAAPGIPQVRASIDLAMPLIRAFETVATFDSAQEMIAGGV